MNTGRIAKDWAGEKPAAGWPQKIAALRKLIRDVGALWPKSTKLSGYAEKGPYHCRDCEYLGTGNTCSHPVVKADEQVKRDKAGRPLVNPIRGCCEFVEPKSS